MKLPDDFRRDLTELDIRYDVQHRELHIAAVFGDFSVVDGVSMMHIQNTDPGGNPLDDCFRRMYSAYQQRAAQKTNVVITYKSDGTPVVHSTQVEESDNDT